jgi:hypothetical protein
VLDREPEEPPTHHPWWTAPKASFWQNLGEEPDGYPSDSVPAFTHDKWWIDVPEANVPRDAAITCCALCVLNNPLH